MKEFLFVLVINGTALAGILLTLFGAFSILKNRNQGEAYAIDKENAIINFDKNIVAFSKLSKRDEDKIKSCIETILSAIITFVAWILEFLVVDAVETEVQIIIKYSFFMSIIIIVVLAIIEKVLSFVIIKIVNLYAKHKGIKVKLPDDFTYEY